MVEPSYPWSPRGDVISVETPELTRVEYRLAPFGARVVAAALDRLIVVAITVVLLLVAGLGAAGAGIMVDGSMALLVVAFFLGANFLLTTLFLAWAEVRGGGQTWGKRRLGLRTVQLTGHPPGVAAALVRNLARVFDDLPPMWMIPTLTASRQRLGDLLAGTCVITERARAPLTPVRWPAESWRALVERRFELPPAAARRLVAADLDLIEYVLRRLPPEQAGPSRREALLRPIVRRYIRRLGVPELEEAAVAAPRRFLGEVGLMLKDRREARA